jgi:hypothetical protein
MSEERQIKIKDKYLEMIIDIGCDYDGYDDTKNLKDIIDELVDLATKGLKNDDKTPFYVSSNRDKPMNILFEEIDNE